MTINVRSIADAPTDISIDNNIVKENQSIGTLVGMLSAIDPDVGDTAAFTLVSGQGDTDNQSFTIEGTSLKTAQVFDYETKSSYSIRVRVTDSTNNTYDEVFIINIKNIPEGPPALSSDNDITNFVLSEQTGLATINTTSHTVNIEVANGTDVSSLVPTIGVSSKATVNPASGEAKDFTSPVTYTVTAEDKTSQNWIITVATEPANTKSIASYNPVTLIQTGDITNNNVEYQTASEVINALPSSIVVTLEDGSEENIPLNWTDTDGYDAKVAGDYTFTARWGTLPSGVDDDDNISLPICQVNVAQGIYTDAETPIVTNKLTDKIAKVNDIITLDATATVKDGGVISYNWYEVDDKSKANPKELSVTKATYVVNTTSSAISYYYCEVTNTNSKVNGNTVASVDTNVSRVTITTVLPISKSMASYSPVTLNQIGDIANNNVEYQTASQVINALPSSIAVTLEDGSAENISLNWTDTDGYNAKVVGDYTFTARWGTLPSGVDNDDNTSLPTCQVKVVQGSTGGGSSSGGSSSSYSSRPKTPTEKANDEINNTKANAQGIIQVSMEAKTTSKGKTSFKLPSNFLKNKAPVELTIKNKDLQVTLLNQMFTEEEKQVELIIEPTNKEKLGLSEKEKEEIGDTPVYNIYLKINDKKVDWESDEDIAITIKLDDKEDKEDHKFVAVYYDRKGNIQILKSSYYQNGKLYFTTKHLSDYGVVYVEPTFKDIENHWAKEAIEALTAKGIIKGISKDEFRPEESISRAEMVTLMVRYFGFTSDNTDVFISNSQKAFDDVDSSKYYANPIAIAKEIGLVKGCGKNQFKPLESISRQDMMVLLQRVIEISGEYTNIKPTEKSYLNFSDSNEISSYALKSVKMMINSEIVKERLTGIYPKGKASRAELAHALYNIMKTNMK